MKHLLIRILIVLGIPTLTGIYFFGYYIPKLVKTQRYMCDPGMGVVILIFLELLILTLLLGAETIWLHWKKRQHQRNLNLYLLAALGLLLLFCWFSINH
jgi:hypothetical protein